MHFVRPFFLLPIIYKSATWRFKNADNSIFLTFDDGPIPEITPWILDILKEKKINATFFCVADNVRKYPQIFERIIREGHQIGNHTYNHLKGWTTLDEEYFDNVEKANKLLQSKLFRPPYGRIKFSQSKVLAKKYKIVMWDVLTGDYNPKISPEQCLENTVNYTKNGSIIVFHDNIKAIKNVQYALPRAIDELGQKGFTFKTIP